MPQKQQAYVLVWQDDNVLIAKKKVRGARFGGQVTQPSILNYAGQFVFPGGKMELGETAAQAARREFFEETGHKLDWDVKKSECIERIGHAILYVESGNINKMAEIINRNLKNGSTKCEELEMVTVVTRKDAFSLLNAWLPQDEDVKRELGKRSKWYNDRSWFTDAL
jgi:hypothetical protein